MSKIYGYSKIPHTNGVSREVYRSKSAYEESMLEDIHIQSSEFEELGIPYKIAIEAATKKINQLYSLA